MTRHRDEGLVEVELVDPADLGAGPTPVPGRVADGAPPAPVRRRRRVVLAGAAVLAVAAVVVTNVVQVRADAALRARLAEVTGAVETGLADPLTEAWTTEGAAPLTSADGVLVVSHPDGRLEGLDAATGTSVWRAAEDPDARHCTGLDDLADPWSPAPAMVICTNPGQAPVLTVVSAATGESLGRVDLPGAPLTYDRWGDVLVARWDADDRMHLLAWDLTTASERWRWTGPPMSEEERARISVAWDGGGSVRLTSWVQAGDDGVVEEERWGVVDLATGRFRADGADGPEPPSTYTWDLADGWTASASAARDGSRGATLTVRDPGGDVTVERTGWPLLTLTDDGGLDPLPLLADDGDLEAVDPVTGEVVWTRASSVYPYALARVSGVLLLGAFGAPGDGRSADGEEAVAIDLRTGEELWRSAGTGPVATDGRRFLLLRYGTAGDTLVAVDLRTGQELWTRELGRGESVRAMAGQVVVDDGVRTTVLR